MKIDDFEKIPKEHKLDVSVVTKQTLGVFSHQIRKLFLFVNLRSCRLLDLLINFPANNKDEVVPETEKIFMEGRIVQKLECRPCADTCYMKMKLDSIRKASVPTKRVMSLDKIVQNFKPVSDHKHNIEYKEKKKSEGKKARDDKNAVMDMLFNAFEKHQYYNIKDLVKITRQPISYLKEILKEVCDYNMKNPHKNMWELKKEYRHYKVDEVKVDKPEESDSESD
jgi:transcription initiation factor TFIIF subunit beta